MNHKFLSVIALGAGLGFLVMDIQSHLWRPVPMWAIIVAASLVVVVPEMKRLWFGEAKQPLIRRMHWPRQW